MKKVFFFFFDFLYEMRRIQKKNIIFVKKYR